MHRKSEQRAKSDNLFLSYSLVLAVVFATPLLSACWPNAGPTAESTGETKPTKLMFLHLDVKESDLKNPSSDFEFFPGGHFGDKTQYNGRIADEFGGAYAVHCRSGVPFSIEVKYQGKGIPREEAMKVMNRLLPTKPGWIIEHDDEDRQKKDTKQAAEFFYFKENCYAELLYAENSDQNVVQVNVFMRPAENSDAEGSESTTEQSGEAESKASDSKPGEENAKAEPTQQENVEPKQTEQEKVKSDPKQK